MPKTVSDEAIIAALMQASTVKEAAEAAGTTPRTIYTRMQEREFQAAYMDAENDLIRRAVFTVNEKLSAAIDTVTEIMTDPEVNPNTRLQAAQMIINNAEKFADRLARDERQSVSTRKDPFAFEF